VAAAARRLAAANDVDLDTALEILSLVRDDEKLAGRVLSTVARGIVPSFNLPTTAKAAAAAGAATGAAAAAAAAAAGAAGAGGGAMLTKQLTRTKSAAVKPAVQASSSSRGVAATQPVAEGDGTAATGDFAPRPSIPGGGGAPGGAGIASTEYYISENVKVAWCKQCKLNPGCLRLTALGFSY